MPIYEYRCEACGNQFEKLVRGSGTAVACPGCGGEKVDQQLSTFASQMGAGKTAAAPAGGCGKPMCGVPGYCGRN